MRVSSRQLRARLGYFGSGGDLATLRLLRGHQALKPQRGKDAAECANARPPGTASHGEHLYMDQTGC